MNENLKMIRQLFKSKHNRRTEQATELNTRATECEEQARQYEMTDEIYLAGKYAGQAIIYNMWASSIKSKSI